MDEDSENGDISGGNGCFNIHTLSKQNVLSSTINSNDSDDIEMNAYLNNGYVSCEISLINSHTRSQCN